MEDMGADRVDNRVCGCRRGFVALLCFL